MFRLSQVPIASSWLNRARRLVGRKGLIALVEIAARGRRCVVPIDDWRQGRAVFTADDQRIDAVAGDILVVPPDAPHTFANAGASVLEMMGIHASERFVTIWLDGRSAPSGDLAAIDAGSGGLRQFPQRRYHCDPRYQMSAYG